MAGALLSAAILGLVIRDWLPGLLACVALVPAFLAMSQARSPMLGGLISAVGALGLATAAFEGALAALPWAFPLALGLSLPGLGLPGVLCSATRRIGSRGLAIWSLPFTWTASEFLSGQRWLWGVAASPIALGYTQVDTPLLQIASSAGVHGVTFLVLVANASISHGLLARSFRPLIGLALITATALAATLDPSDPSQDSAASLSIGLVQPAIDRDWYLPSREIPLARRHILDRLRELSQPVSGSELLIWPEGAVPFGTSSEELSRLAARISRAQPELLAGGETLRDGRRFNSVLHISEGVTPVFDKLAPVPLGEAGIVAGRWLVVARLADWWVGPLICLDSVYSTFSIRLARQGAQVLIVFSDDSFAQHMATPGLHLRTSRFRAVETGLPLVFASAVGPSAIVSPRGAVVAGLQAGASSSLQGEISGSFAATPFVRFGNWAGFTCVCVSLLLVGAIWRARHLSGAIR
jgi:apolipoprotein N-acyltransferase